jgi:endonuclease YncB( thermonuclease family)
LPKPQSEPATVINVHDGDTITVKLGWQTVKVRLCGIDAPALSQPFGVQSRDHLRSLLASAGNQVILYISDTIAMGVRWLNFTFRLTTRSSQKRRSC